MQLVAINSSLVTQATAISRRRPNTRREELGSRKKAEDFTSLLESFGNVIEAEFEEVDDGETLKSSSQKKYFDVLFPEFLLKCRYVNYYV